MCTEVSSVFLNMDTRVCTADCMHIGGLNKPKNRTLKKITIWVKTGFTNIHSAHKVEPFKVLESHPAGLLPIITDDSR